MHAEVEACLRETLPAALQHAGRLPQTMVGFWELKKGSGEKGGFTARYDYRPCPPDGPDLCPSGLIQQVHDMLLHGETQELSYKFALRYASLSERPEQRLRDFEDAKAIYRCRSLLAHGGRVRDDHAARIGGRWVSLHEAAETASVMLRRLLQCFLPDGVTPGFLRPDYWERRLFDTPEAE